MAKTDFFKFVSGELYIKLEWELTVQKVKPKMAEIDVQCQSFSIVFVCAVDTKECVRAENSMERIIYRYIFFIWYIWLIELFRSYKTELQSLYNYLQSRYSTVYTI